MCIIGLLFENMKIDIKDITRVKGKNVKLKVKLASN